MSLISPLRSSTGITPLRLLFNLKKQNVVSGFLGKTQPIQPKATFLKCEKANPNHPVYWRREERSVEKERRKTTLTEFKINPKSWETFSKCREPIT